MRTCTKCGETKGADEFFTAPLAPDGLMSWCKDCFNKYTREKHYKERRDAGIPTKEFVAIADNESTCRWCGRTLPIERFTKQYVKTDNSAPIISRCKDCDNIRKREPEAWRNRETPGVMIEALKLRGLY